MKLLTQEIRKKLPPLYAQEGQGGGAIVHCKFFTPDSGWTWWILYAELSIKYLMWSCGLCRAGRRTCTWNRCFRAWDAGCSA